jgi:hypothetical protein
MMCQTTYVRTRNHNPHIPYMLVMAEMDIHQGPDMMSGNYRIHNNHDDILSQTQAQPHAQSRDQ